MSLPYLILLAIVGWGVGSLFYKVANDAIHPLMVSTIVTVVYVVLTPLAFVSNKFDRSLTWTGVIFSVLGGLAMGIGSIGYSFALKKGGAGEITAVAALYPALTLMLSMIFLHEEMSWRKGIGILLALSSVLVLSFK
jgi:transporter family protein